MASIIRTSLAMGWDGKAAENGLQKMATTVDASGKKVTELGKGMSDAAKAASEAAKENERFAKSLEKMNALEKENAKAKRDTKQRRSTMTASEIEKDIGKETMAKKLAGMNALERQDYMQQERIRQRRSTMTAKQIEADIEREKKAAVKKAANEEWAKKSLFQKAASMTAGATDIASFAGMAVGAGNAVLSFAKLGGALETMRIKAAYMAGSFKLGVAAIEELREASMVSGVALADNVKGMNNLATAGLTMQASTETVKSLQNAAELLGEGGMATLTSTIAGMYKAGVAGEAEFNSLQASGLKVWESLAEGMTKATGKAHSVEDAIAAVRDGTVSAAKGIAAIGAAGASDALREANARFAGSFDGQFKRLVETATETFRDISKIMLDAINIPSLMAGIRGVFVGVKDIIMEIGKLFGDMVDPKDKAKGIESSFRAARDITIDLAQSLVEAGVRIYDWMRKSAAEFGSIMDRTELYLLETKKSLVSSYDPVLGKTDRTATQYAMHNTGMGGMGPKEFDDMMMRITQLKVKNAHAAVAAGAAFQPTDMKAITGAFDAVRNKAKEADKVNDAERAKLPPPKPPGAAPVPPAGAIIPPALDKIAEAANKAKIEIEAMARASKDFANNTIREMRTPFEVFDHEMKTLSQRMAEAGQAGLNEKDTAAFKEAMARKAGKTLQDLIGANIGGDSMFSAAATRGSAADVETRVRAQYGEQNMSVQDKIRIATERAAYLSEQQLDYQRKLVDEAIKQNKLKPVQAVMEK
jgi:hypothetical protein